MYVYVCVFFFDSLLDPESVLYWSAVATHAFCFDHPSHRRHSERLLGLELERVSAISGIGIPFLLQFIPPSPLSFLEFMNVWWRIGIPRRVPVAVASTALLVTLNLRPIHGFVFLENTREHHQAYFSDMAQTVWDTRSTMIRGRIYTSRRHSMAEAVYGESLFSTQIKNSSEKSTNIEDIVDFFRAAVYEHHAEEERELAQRLRLRNDLAAAQRLILSQMGRKKAIM